MGNYRPSNLPPTLAEQQIDLYYQQKDKERRNKELLDGVKDVQNLNKINSTPGLSKPNHGLVGLINEDD